MRTSALESLKWNLTIGSNHYRKQTHVGVHYYLCKSLEEVAFQCKRLTLGEPCLSDFMSCLSSFKNLQYVTVLGRRISVLPLPAHLWVTVLCTDLGAPIPWTSFSIRASSVSQSSLVAEKNHVFQDLILGNVSFSSVIKARLCYFDYGLDVLPHLDPDFLEVLGLRVMSKAFSSDLGIKNFPKLTYIILSDPKCHLSGEKLREILLQTEQLPSTLAFPI